LRHSVVLIVKAVVIVSVIIILVVVSFPLFFHGFVSISTGGSASDG